MKKWNVGILCVALFILGLLSASALAAQSADQYSETEGYLVVEGKKFKVMSRPQGEGGYMKCSFDIEPKMKVSLNGRSVSLDALRGKPLALKIGVTLIPCSFPSSTIPKMEAVVSIEAITASQGYLEKNTLTKWPNPDYR